MMIISCANNKPPASGTEEDLLKINALVQRLEQDLGVDFEREDILISKNKGDIWVFFRTDKESDRYQYIKLGDYEFMQTNLGPTITNFSLTTLSTEFRYRLIMDTLLFGYAYDYLDYADSINPGQYFEEDQINPKDLEKIGAIIEHKQREDIKKVLMAKYGLSVERSEHISSLYHHFKKLQKRRKLNFNELNYLSKGILGVDYHKILTESEEDLVQKAAKINDTSPEVIRDVVDSLLN